jgi:hypothetical protein
MSNFKVFTILIFAFILLSGIAVFASAATYTPGVSTGNYVKYGNFVGSGPGLEDFNNIDSQTVQVTNVAGTQVTLLSTGQYRNGTATQGNGTSSVWDIAAGIEDGSPATQGTIIAANLNVGDAIPPPDTYSVNSTENRQYLGGSRSVNILKVAIATPDYNSTLSYVYDKASGMLLESSSQTITQSDSGLVTSKYFYSVTETNVFSSSPTPTSINPGPSIPLETILIAIIVIIIVVVVAVIALFRKRI